MTEEKIKTIDILTNCIQSIDNKKIKDDIAYLIHCIIDGIKIDYNIIAQYKILANKDLFVKI